MKIDILIEQAKEKKIKYYGHMNKKELCKALGYDEEFSLPAERNRKGRQVCLINNDEIIRFDKIKTLSSCIGLSSTTISNRLKNNSQTKVMYNNR